MGVIRSVEMETMPGLIGTPRESNTQNSPRLCAVRPGYTAFECTSANA
ncbi:MAG: hypothetical protein LBM69_01160 [Lachnospiraceae bacterium]|nr:hypothetical protein [Lachnospiraceae bacterium]